MNRRHFLNRLMTHALGASTLSATMGLFSQAKAQIHRGPVTDYRALVCVYLYGGNDGFNMLIPRDNQRYQTYADSRGASLAIPQGDLLPIDDGTQGAFGLHPACGALQALYQNQNLALLCNSGTLVRPTTQTDYQNGIDLPRHLFSHNSQQDQSMTALPQMPSRVGWAGQAADLLHPSANGGALVPFNLSTGGQNLLQVGQSTTPSILSPYAVPTFEACDLGDLASHCGQSLDAVLQHTALNTQLLEQAHANTYLRTHQVASLISSALENSINVNPAIYPTAPIGFPGNPNLSNQLQMVSRLISVAPDMGHQRSIFFVNLGGWDTHDRQLQNHDMLLANLSDNLAAFYQQLNDFGLQNQVITFTASDFGRTLTSNGDGSDHGWGNNHLIMGGPVLGGQLFGDFPDLTLGGPDDADLGRLIPTTPVDALYASLLRWLGVADEHMLNILPNLTHFGGAGTDLGFIGP